MGMYVVNTDILNIRSSPSADSDDNYVGFLRKGEKIWLEDSTVTGTIPADSTSNQWRIYGENYVLDEWVDKLGIELPEKVLADWNKQLPTIPAAWRQTKGRGIKVAILDTGMDMSHPNLQGIDVIDVTESGKDDVDGHGTAIAGIIGARPGANYDYGIFGVAPECTLLPIKIGITKQFAPQHIVEGLEKAIEARADIVNLSFFVDDHIDIKRKIDQLLDGGAVVICAAQDNRHLTYETLAFPASERECISVGCCNTLFLRKYAQDINESVNIVSSMIGRATCSITSSSIVTHEHVGSSFICAYVSGIIALLMAAHPHQMKKSEIIAALRNYSVLSNNTELDNTNSFCYYMP